MPSVECGFDSAGELIAHGPILRVRIGFLVVPTTEYGALVDTGANASCIDSELAAELKLPVVDRIAIDAAFGPQFTNIYLAQIDAPSLRLSIYGRFAGVYLHAGEQEHDALIGRDFLKLCSMAYQGNTGSVVLSKTQ